MNTHKKHNQKTELNRTMEIISRLAEISAVGNYIYRGESLCYQKVSSTLYRELKGVGLKHLNIADIQSEVVEATKAYTSESKDNEILTMLHHYGGKTNLIDFTTDYYVALFFACYGHPDKAGRVIVLNKNSVANEMLRYPSCKEHRVNDQKGLFVEPPKGYIEQQFDVVSIPKDLKLFILDHLRIDHGIEPASIYNDIHGFISSQNAYWMAYRGFYDGRSEKDKGDRANKPEEKQKYYKEAVTHYTNAIENDLRQPRIYNNRGNALVAIGKVEMGIEDFSKAIELYPDYALAYVNRGEAFLREGKIDKAIHDYNFAIELQPELAEAYNNRGIVYCKVGNLPKALEDYNIALQLKADFADAYNNRGVVYGDTNNFLRAISDYSKAIKLRTDFVDAYVNRGVAYGRMDKFDEAIKDFNAAISLNRYHSGAYYNLGNVFLLKGDFNRAIENYDISLQLDPDDSISYCYRGIARLSQKEWDKARSDLNYAQDKSTDIITVFHSLYKDIFTFERKNDVKLPKDIVAMLTKYPVNPLTTTQKMMTHDGKISDSAAVLELLDEFRNAGKPLHEYLQDYPSRGITTGYNKAFIVKRETKDGLIAEHQSSAKILKPLLMTNDIKRWQANPQDNWLIFAQQGIDIDAYPAIKKHLEKHSDALKERSGNQEWYELQVVFNDTNRFENSKCIYPEFAHETAFSFDDKGYYVTRPATLLPTNELWILGVLNTKAVSWFYARTSPQKRGPYLKFTSRNVSQIPIPNLELDFQAIIHRIVEYILYLKKQPSINSKDLKFARDRGMLGYYERIIDGLVYEAYLTHDLHNADKHFFQPLLDEQLTPLEEMKEDKMFELRNLFETLYEKKHPVARNLFFLDSVRSIRIIESKT